MSAPVRLAGYLLALGVVFGVGALAGNAVGPIGEPAAPAHTPGGEHR